jgi:hypothetical protein
MVPVEVSSAASGTVPEAVDLGTLGGVSSHADGVSGDTVVGGSDTGSVKTTWTGDGTRTDLVKVIVRV